MKFTTTKKSQPVASTQPLSDAEFVGRLAAIDGMLADNLADFSVQDEKVEVAESFKLLNLQIVEAMMDDAALEAFAKSTPGLKEMYTDMQSFKAAIAKEAKACEGFLDGMLGDMNTGLVGAIIAFARNNLPSVKEQIDICKKKLAETTDAEVAKRVQQMFIRVRSKYLPSRRNYADAIKALNAALALVASNPKSSFDSLVAKLKGSMYEAKTGSKAPQGQQDADWKYVGVRLLPTVISMVPGAGVVAPGVQIAERYWYDKSQPVGERGWTDKAQFTAGLKELESVIAALAKAIGALSKAKEGDDVKAAAEFCKWAEKEIVYIGRGITTAIRKVYAGNFVRLVSNRFIH